MFMRPAAFTIASLIAVSTAVASSAATAVVNTPTSSAAASTSRQQCHRPLVFGHRGAAGYRPDHTLASYELGARMGADYIEPDLVSTKDGVLVSRHENDISGTSDVAQHPEFADRKRTKIIDGTKVTGWFTEDFTLAELKTLHAVERLPQLRQHNTIYDGQFQIATFQEIIDLRAKLSRELHRDIGIVPELKHSTYFGSIGLLLEPKLVVALDRNHLNRPGAKVIVQSFEVHNLQVLHHQLWAKLVQLTAASGQPYDFTVRGDKRTWADITSARGLREVARYAQFVGPEKNQVIARDAADNLLPRPTTLVPDAHRAGLRVVAYTFRAENYFLPGQYRRGTNPSDYGDIFGEYRRFFDAGVDALFTDNPNTAVQAVGNEC